MKRFIGVLIVGLFAVSVHAAKPNAGWQLIVDSDSIRDAGTGYSDPVLVNYTSDLSYIFTVESGTSPNVTVTYQVIDSNSSDYSVLGSTTDASLDMSFDVSYSSNNYISEWVTPTTGSTLVSGKTTIGKVADGFAVPVTRWIRFVVTGNSATSGAVYYSISVGRYSER